MGVELHGLADHIGHLVKPAVIHIVQCLKNTALHGF